VTPSVTIPRSHLFDIHSENADADYQIRVAEPIEGAIPFPPGPRPVLYVLDADLFLGTAVEMTRLMSQLYGELPPLLVVGIGYETESPVVQAELRARDFTPTADSGFEEMARSMPGAPEPTLPEGRRLGRAPEFLDFLLEEAIPFVEERYAVAEDRSILFGSSLGGLFVLHAMLERPEAFDAYVAVSPAIWWDNAYLMRREEALASSREDLEAHLFLAVGGEEERADIPSLAPFRMVSNVETLATRLRERSYPSLELSTFIADGESHTSVVPVGLTRALRHVLGP
jgi:predicted alpha/beta superfamily hydrolase